MHDVVSEEVFHARRIDPAPKMPDIFTGDAPFFAGFPVKWNRFRLKWMAQ